MNVPIVFPVELFGVFHECGQGVEGVVSRGSSTMQRPSIPFPELLHCAWKDARQMAGASVVLVTQVSYYVRRFLIRILLPGINGWKAY